MKHLIIAGPDCVGKNLLIKNIIKDFENITVRHFTVPKNLKPGEITNYWKDEYSHALHLVNHARKEEKCPHKLYVWNRSHICETVYGPLYRNSNSEWIWKMEQFWDLDKEDETYLILLYADPEFIVKQEDGESISNELEKRQKEVQLYLEGFEKSIIKNKLKLKVNEGDEYVPAIGIWYKVSNFIHGLDIDKIIAENSTSSHVEQLKALNRKEN